MQPKVMGWCPGALRPMMSGDGLVVRIRPHGGRLTAAEMKGIAKASQTHGNGIIDLSARANLQIRGVDPKSHSALIADLDALGLIDSDAATETRRNIIVTPFWRDGDGVQAVVQALAHELAAPDAPNLPAKFGFSVDGGAHGACLRTESADIRLEVATDGVRIHADRDDLTGLFTPSDAPRAALRLANWFVGSAGIRDGRGRMAEHLARGNLPPVEFRKVPLSETMATTPVPGPIPGIGPLIGLEFGQITAAILDTLSDHIPAIRLTPWRMFLCEGAVPDLDGLISDATSPLLRVTACTGHPGCLQAFQETRALARALAASAPARLHVSGCAKGCAHPSASPMTLTATAQGFDLALNARAGGIPVETSLPADPTIITESLIRHATYL